MKKIKTIGITVIFTISQGITVWSQHLQVSGKSLKDANGNTIILRGINYPVIDDYNVELDNHATIEHKIDQVALAGGNCIRFPWYVNGTHYKDGLNPADNPAFGPGTTESYVNNGHLSHMLQYTYSKGMIPILEIHNLTGASDHTVFQNVVMGFWTNPQVLQIIEENKKYLIINLANEYGDVDGTTNPVASLTSFKNNYTTSVNALRNLGVKVPIMIDAPDYGQSSTLLVNIANDIVTADPLRNIIFSVHAYWGYYATTPAAVQTKMNEMQSTGHCFVLGEIANTQADVPTYCGELSLANLYPVILQEACTRDIGWLAWSWNQDCDATRQMSNNGEYNNLTTYGSNIINNVNYGLKSTGGCGAVALPDDPITTSTGKIDLTDLNIYPNPALDKITITATIQNGKFEIHNSVGTLIQQGIFNEQQVLEVKNLSNGIYIVSLISEKGTIQQKFTIQ